MAHRVRQQAGSYRFCVWRGSSVVQILLRRCRYPLGGADIPSVVQISLRWCRYSFGRTGIRCRSALAREGVVSATAGVSGPPRSPASRLLQVLRLARVFSRADIASVVRRFLRSCRYPFGRADIPCRSALAREGIVSATAGVRGPPRSPASRLLQVLRLARVFSRAEIPSVVQISPRSCGYSFGRTGIRCRSALAREGIVSATEGVSGPPRSPASRLLQVLRLARAFSGADIPSVVQISLRSYGHSL
jgi:hypothetical protein